MRHLIDFKNTATEEQINQYLLDHQCTVLHKFVGFEQVYLVNTDVGLALTDIIDRIVNDESTQISPHEIYINTGKTNYTDSILLDPSNLNQWWMTYSIEGTDLEQSTVNVPKRGKNVNVYLMDSGININHPEFQFANVTLLHSFNNDFTDYNGHGTALASVICGKTCGLADPNLKIVKIFQNGIPVYQSDILIALESILLDIQNNPKHFSIVNMSWGIDKNTYIENKIALLRAAGAMCIAAAGNSGQPISNITPASMEECFVVGSYGEDFKPSLFSNYGIDQALTTPGENNYGVLDIWAPGENIRVAALDGTYKLVGGTSISAAIHSAALAYNFSYLTTEDGYVTGFYLNNNENAIKWNQRWAWGKRGLLDLSDPKYAGSVNYLTTYFVDGNTEELFYHPERKAVIFENDNYSMLLGAVWTYDSCEIIEGALPPGAEIKNMAFSWTPTNVLNGSEYRVFSFKLKLNRGLESDIMDISFLIYPPEKKETEWGKLSGDPLLDSFVLFFNSCEEANGTTQCGSSYCTVLNQDLCKCCFAIKGLCEDCRCETDTCE